MRHRSRADATVLLACAGGALAALAFASIASGCNALSGIEDFTAAAPPDTGAADTGLPEDASLDTAAAETGVRGDGSPDAGPPPDSSASDGYSEVGPDRDGAQQGDAPTDTGTDVGACDGGTALVAHSNGLGQTFYDCVPFGTYSKALAFDACGAFTGDVSACVADPTAPCARGDIVCVTTAPNCACWGYDGMTIGEVARTCTCFNSTTLTWK